METLSLEEIIKFGEKIGRGAWEFSQGDSTIKYLGRYKNLTIELSKTVDTESIGGIWAGDEYKIYLLHGKYKNTTIGKYSCIFKSRLIRTGNFFTDHYEKCKLEKGNIKIRKFFESVESCYLQDTKRKEEKIEKKKKKEEELRYKNATRGARKLLNELK